MFDNKSNGNNTAYTPNPQDHGSGATSVRGAFVNATVYPMDRPDAPDRTCTAVLWDDGRIVLIGEDAPIRTEAERRGIEVVDLEKRVVLPGFVDAHTHFVHLGREGLLLDLSDCTDREALLERTHAWLVDHDGPVIGEHFQENDWPDRTLPQRQELDAIAPDRPLVLRRICGHVAVANSAALERIWRRWPDPDLVDQETGRLLEDPSLYLDEVLPLPEEVRQEAVRRACTTALAEGVTTVGAYEQAGNRSAIRTAAATDNLRIRVVQSIYAQQFDAEVADGFRTGRQEHGGRLRDGALKLFLDGSLGGHTAFLRAPYTDRPDSCGTPNWTLEEVVRFVQEASIRGIQVHCHAIGDAAIDMALDAYAAVGEETTRRLRHRIEHFEIAHDDQVRRAAALGVVVSCQPNFVGAWSGRGGMYEDRLGDRLAINNRFRSFRTAGLDLAFGSDCMPFGPRHGIQCALEHPIEAERLTPAEAVWHYTRGAAWSLHADDVGHLVPGAAADLLVLDRTDLEGPAMEWVIQEVWSMGTLRYRTGTG